MFSRLRSFWNRLPRRSAAGGARRGIRRRLRFQSLEPRSLLAALPYGATALDTAEYMLGEVLVTVVLMESSEETSADNPNTENWMPSSIEAAKQKVREGTQWWEETLARQTPTPAHALNFHYDFSYADSPVPTDYEPIANSSSAQSSWVREFLDFAGQPDSGDLSLDMRLFNHAQRVEHETHWAFTVFVVNDEHDEDGEFAGGGFPRAFAFAGGRYFISPAGRPESTFAHETGHIFWARDEYAGGGSYTDRRGYYDTQNLNAYDNRQPGFEPVPSIMARDDEQVLPALDQWGPLLTTAYNSHTSSPSSLEMIGWRDTDQDGRFDVLDTPLSLEGSGYYDADAKEYRFLGSSAVSTLPNRNPSGLRNDITINQVSRAEVRIDGGSWQATATYGAYEVDLDLRVSLTPGPHSVEIRTVDAQTGITSPVFWGSTDRPTTTQSPGINGFVFHDQNANGEVDAGEPGLEGQIARLLDDNGQPLSLEDRLEPDAHDAFQALNDASASVRLTAVGDDAADAGIVAALASSSASTGAHVFGLRSSTSGWVTTWSQDSRQLRMDFASPVGLVSMDAIADGASDFARLEVFDRFHNLLARYTTPQLSAGEVETMIVSRTAADISYAIARGHMNTGVQLDNLRFGHVSSTTTGPLGAFTLPSLPTGDYRVEVLTPEGWRASSPAPAVHSVSIPPSPPTSQVDFGFRPAEKFWQNPVNIYDVNQDGFVAPVDALAIINLINGAEQISIPTSTLATAPPFYDVNGDELITATDVLRVINELNRRLAEAPGAEGEAFVAPPAAWPVVVGGHHGSSINHGSSISEPTKSDRESLLAWEGSTTRKLARRASMIRRPGWERGGIVV